ncbi:4-hydroxybenzoate transporter PcaK [compost metagenome]
MRATGVSWMHGIGRSGAIISSSMGGVLLGIFPGATSIFIILAIPALLAAITIINHQKAHPAEMVKGIDITDLPALSRTMNNR